jgi:putative flippase GtrA
MHRNLLTKDSLVGDSLRFIIVGIANTLFTLLIFQCMVSFFSPLLSYYSAWAVGLIVLLMAFPTYVFRGSRLTLNRGLATIGIYATSLLLGSLMLTQSQAQGMNPRLGILLVIALTTAFNFGASRIIYRLISL